jgi:hypothetical protein
VKLVCSQSKKESAMPAQLPSLPTVDGFLVTISVAVWGIVRANRNEGRAERLAKEKTRLAETAAEYQRRTLVHH